MQDQQVILILGSKRNRYNKNKYTTQPNDHIGRSIFCIAPAITVDNGPIQLFLCGTNIVS